MAKLEEQLAALATMSSAQLCEEWRSVFGEDVPTLPSSLIRRVLAYKLQERALGGLPAHAQRMLGGLGGLWLGFGVPDDYAVRLLPVILSSFRKTHPRITVDVRCQGLAERLRGAVEVARSEGGVVRRSDDLRVVRERPGSGAPGALRSSRTPC